MENGDRCVSVRKQPSTKQPSTNQQWLPQIESVGSALSKLKKIEELLQNTMYNVSSINNLKSELVSLSLFYSFLVNTQNIVCSPELGYFCILPSEIIVYIYSFIDAVQLCRLCSVCRFFKEVGYDDTTWQQLCSRLNFYDEHKLPSKSWKWICESRLHVFREGQVKNGVGTYLWPSKLSLSSSTKSENRYCGEWKENLREGYGTYYWCNGSLYAGLWKQDKRDGYGIRTWPNGNKYIGEYKNHKRHGIGEFTFSNGSIFKGNFEDNKFIHGTYTWPNGRVYTGDWNTIYRHGSGSYVWPDGRTYVGDWKADRRHGHGIYSWPDGDSFEGEFSEGKRLGNGVLKRSNGDVYFQIWKEDKFEEFNKGLPDSDQNGTVVISKKRKSHESGLDENTETFSKQSKIESDSER